MKYYLIAGEASGDLHASNLMKALLRHDEGAEFRFFGGDKMKAVGGTLVRHYKDLAYMGFIQVALHARTILENMNVCKKDIVSWKPDAVILVDYPGFNLRIAEFLHRETSIHVYYYIPPKIWAWKTWRIKAMRRDIEEIFSILPFEVPFYGTYGCGVHYVGNPCMDSVDEYLKHAVRRADFLRANALDERPIVAVLAGSRKQEIRDNLPLMLRAVPDSLSCQIVVAGAPGIDPSFYDEFLTANRRTAPGTDSVRIVFNQTYPLLQHARAALVTSGTATLETAIFRVPQVVCYHTRFGRAVTWLSRHFLKVRFISLVNLIADKEVVTELVASRMTEDNIRREFMQIWPDSEKRTAMLDGYDCIVHTLGEAGVSQRAAKQIVCLLQKN